MTVGPRRSMIRAMLAGLCLLGLAAAATAPELAPLRNTDTQLEPLRWSDLDGWDSDDHIASFAAFLASCRPFLNTSSPQDSRPVYGGLWQECRRAAQLRPASSAEAQAFFEENFRPVRI